MLMGMMITSASPASRDEILAHRAWVVPRRLPEIARHEIPEPVEVADDERAVVAELVVQLLDLRGGGLAAQQVARRITGQHPRHGEDEDREQEQRDERKAEPFEDVAGDRPTILESALRITLSRQKTRAGRPWPPRTRSLRSR
jgi:hypothetical protein